MHLMRYPSPAYFLRAAEPFLLAHEAEHMTILGVIGRLAYNPYLVAEEPYLAVVEDRGVVLGAAVMIPPHHLMLSYTAEPRILPLLASDVCAFAPPPPGVIAHAGMARAFTEHWQRQTRQRVRAGMRMRCYRLDDVIPVEGIPGRMRRMVEADRPTVAGWLNDFGAEALPDDPPDDADELIDRLMAHAPRDPQGLFVWEDKGQPAAMATVTTPTKNGLRVNLVYTPPERRRNGYASALVAAISERILDSGRLFAALSADLANPTANHIYQGIGYMPVCDLEEYRFGDAAGNEQ